ncbi:MAG: hypothetical protein JO359_13705 [Candidatus Eremiobacteraeota bacterium]|nr:hypothetical protein [Candidatus Eremiobacteraeota bacterium]
MRRTRLSGLAALVAFAPAIALGATPSPSPKATPRLVTVQQKIKPQLPTSPLHATYTVETNKLGQVVRVRSVEPSKNPAFDAMTYGNSLQAFIRHPDGTAVAGVYKLIYDYSPQTKKVRRDVELLQAGGVNPDAPGAVTVELQKDAKTQAADRAKQDAAKKAAASKLPDFNQIVSPSPKP